MEVEIGQYKKSREQGEGALTYHRFFRDQALTDLSLFVWPDSRSKDPPARSLVDEPRDLTIWTRLVFET